MSNTPNTNIAESLLADKRFIDMTTTILLEILADIHARQRSPKSKQIIRKLLSDKRLIDVMARILAEILINNNIHPKATKKQKVADWTDKTERQLRDAYTYCRRRNIEMTTEFESALAARFPGYDLATHKFINRVHKKKAVKDIDWTTKTDRQLQSLHNYYCKHHIEMTTEFESELVARFPGYDLTTHKFTKTVQERDDEKMTTKKIEAESQKNAEYWHGKDDFQLRQALWYRTKRNLPIEPNLNNELAARFPGYDPVTHQFNGQKHKLIQKNHAINWATKSAAQQLNAFRRRVRKNQSIEDSLNDALVISFPDTYSKAKRKFIKDIATKPKERKLPRAPRAPRAQRVIDWNLRPTQNMMIAYKKRILSGKPIEDSLNNALSKRFPTTYDEVKRRFIDRSQQEQQIADAQAATKAKKQNATQTASQLSVTLEQVQQTSDATFYNVYINGKIILEKHMNTELKLFADGALLGIHGTVTDSQNLPPRPLWLVYKPGVGQMEWAGHTKMSDYAVYAQRIDTTPTGVNLRLSNESTVILEDARLKRMAGMSRFTINQR